MEPRMYVLGGITRISNWPCCGSPCQERNSLRNWSSKLFNVASMEKLGVNMSMPVSLEGSFSSYKETSQ